LLEFKIVFMSLRALQYALQKTTTRNNIPDVNP